MTRIWTLKSNQCVVSNFSLKSLVNSFMLHAAMHDIKPGMFTLVVHKASHDPETGYWEETKETDFWIDPVEGAEVIYEVLKNV